MVLIPSFRPGQRLAINHTAANLDQDLNPPLRIPGRHSFHNPTGSAPALSHYHLDQNPLSRSASATSEGAERAHRNQASRSLVSTSLPLCSSFILNVPRSMFSHL